MRDDILDFKVLFYSKDGKTSPVLDYLTELVRSNRDMSKKAFQAITRLPLKIYDGQDVKPFVHSKYKFWELRVQSKNSICRFFYTVEEPNIIVFFGFTKKTQKTETKHIAQGVNNLEDYKLNHIAIEL